MTFTESAVESILLGIAACVTCLFHSAYNTSHWLWNAHRADYRRRIINAVVTVTVSISQPVVYARGRIHGWHCSEDVMVSSLLPVASLGGAGADRPGDTIQGVTPEWINSFFEVEFIRTLDKRRWKGRDGRGYGDETIAEERSSGSRGWRLRKDRQFWRTLSVAAPGDTNPITPPVITAIPLSLESADIYCELIRSFLHSCKLSEHLVCAEWNPHIVTPSSSSSLHLPCTAVSVVRGANNLV